MCAPVMEKDSFFSPLKKSLLAALFVMSASLTIWIAGEEFFLRQIPIEQQDTSKEPAAVAPPLVETPVSPFSDPESPPSVSGASEEQSASGENTRKTPVAEDAATAGQEGADAEKDAEAGNEPEQKTEKNDEESSGEIPISAPEDSKEIVSGTVEQGDTAAKLLGSDVHDILRATRKHHSLTNIRSGQPYVVVRDKETRAVERFEYEIDSQRKLVVENNGTTFNSRVESIIYDIQLALLQGTVESSLFQSVAALGESPSLAIVVADVFRWDVDFIKDVQDGDSFSILVEKRFRDGQFKNYGRVLGATFNNKGKTFEAFLFRGVSGYESHYNKKGESLKKVLLKAPLAFTRVTSGYSKGRRHPIFRDVRPHEGVDYGAPTGTPIKAVGDGVITKRGWQGGYGNAIALRHGSGLESQYAHMSGYARGMSVGSRVRQGQVIGFVGSTGWATGPHLDFRLKQNGRFINPTRAVNPREERIASGRMSAFGERIVAIRNFLSGKTPLNEYSSEKFN